jgi:acyl-CoA reductase-like NAD-dependent aldehyde dehydrogenase
VIAYDERLAPTRAPLTAARLRALTAAVRAGAHDLRALTPAARVGALDRVAASWLAPDSPWRSQALRELPKSTGYPEATVAVALTNLWQALRAPRLAATLTSELAGHDAHTTPLPALALHVLAGNVPGVGVFGLMAALLAGIPSVVKPAAREPFLPALVVDSIVAVAPELRRVVALAPWRGGTAELDDAAMREADIVLAYGRDATLDRLAARGPRRLLRFGERLSVALVARTATTRATARELAWQTALFDQQGCLSPQIVCVEETTVAETERFAATLAAELAALEQTLPRAPMTLAESAAVWRFIERQRWRAQEGAAVVVHGGDGRPSVVCDRTATIAMSPTFRHLVLVPVADVPAAAEALRTLRGKIEAVAYAGPPDGLDAAAKVAAAADAHRLCPLERLQAPPFAWFQSGYPRLASLVGVDRPGNESPFA